MHLLGGVRLGSTQRNPHPKPPDVTPRPDNTTSSPPQRNLNAIPRCQGPPCAARQPSPATPSHPNTNQRQPKTRQSDFKAAQKHKGHPNTTPVLASKYKPKIGDAIPGGTTQTPRHLTKPNVSQDSLVPMVVDLDQFALVGWWGSSGDLLLGSMWFLIVVVWFLNLRWQGS